MRVVNEKNIPFACSHAITQDGLGIKQQVIALLLPKHLNPCSFVIGQA
jgi:hypothetical protein